jgi:hypothetical protein
MYLIIRPRTRPTQILEEIQNARKHQGNLKYFPREREREKQTDRKKQTEIFSYQLTK